MSKEINQSFLKKLRTLGLIEGSSTLVLIFIAMPLKYLADFPQAVTVAGYTHGLLFLALLVMSLIAIFRVPLGFVWGIVGVFAAIIPLGPFLFDLRLKRIT